MFLRDILQQTIKCRAFDHESYVARGGGGGRRSRGESGRISFFSILANISKNTVLFFTNFHFNVALIAHKTHG